MTTFNKRSANILFRAIDHGFQVDCSDSIENQVNEAELYLLENLPVDRWEFAEVSQSGHHQHVSYYDGEDLDFQSDGEITDFSRKDFYIKEDGSKSVRLPHEIVVDTDARIIQLYDERDPDDIELEFNF